MKALKLKEKICENNKKKNGRKKLIEEIFFVCEQMGHPGPKIKIFSKELKNFVFNKLVSFELHMKKSIKMNQ